MAGLTQIPATPAPTASDANGGAVAREIAPPSAPAATARPVEPAGRTGFEPTDLSGPMLATAMELVAVNALVRAAVQEGASDSEAGRNPPSAVAGIDQRFREARAVSAPRAEEGAQSLLDALRAMGPSPVPRPTLPGNVDALAEVVRGQILQDYRVAFMIYNRLTPAVAQLLR